MEEGAVGSLRTHICLDSAQGTACTSSDRSVPSERLENVDHGRIPICLRVRAHKIIPTEPLDYPHPRLGRSWTEECALSRLTSGVRGRVCGWVGFGRLKQSVMGLAMAPGGHPGVTLGLMSRSLLAWALAWRSHHEATDRSRPGLSAFNSYWALGKRTIKPV